MSEVIKSFQYPEVRTGKETTPSHRMCSAGQKRATSEAYDLLNPGAPIGVDHIMDRAARADFALKRGASIDKHAVISWVVVDLFVRGELDDYADPDGNYLLQTYTGEQLPRNIFSDIEAGKVIF